MPSPELGRGHATSRVHHDARRRGGSVAARGTRAAAADAHYRLSQQLCPQGLVVPGFHEGLNGAGFPNLMRYHLVLPHLRMLPDRKRESVVFPCRGLLEKRACGRVGPVIARAVHRTGHLTVGADARGGAGEKFLCCCFPERVQQPLHNRMLLGTERLWIALPVDGLRRL